MSSGSIDAMAFDSSSSDFARHLQYRAKAGAEEAQLPFSAPPAHVQTRLDELELDWTKLPGIAQRALLWDSGFGVTRKNKVVKFWTLDGHSMTDLTLTLKEFEETGCKGKNCPEPSGGNSYASLYCNGYQMNNASKCVVEDFDDDGTFHASMWGIGGNSTTVPVLCLVWKNTFGPTTATIFRIPSWQYTRRRSVKMSQAIKVARLPRKTEATDPSFPCYRSTDVTTEIEAEMQSVKGSDWVSQWLVEDYPEAAIESGADFNMLLLLPIVLGGIVIIALVWLSVYCIRKRQNNAQARGVNMVASPTPYQQHNCFSPSGCSGQRDSMPRPTLTVSEDRTSSAFTGADLTIQFPYRSSLSHEYGSHPTLKLLHTSDVLVAKRIPVDELTFTRALSKGASGEVWLCECADQQFAAKCLLHTKNHTADAVQAFAEEIELNARLEHPNISKFVGVSWNSLNNLTMVTEYFPVGDLQMYLMKHGDLVSWARDKVRIAVGVAQAVHYLHSLAQPIIHRDLKSKNILLTRQLEAKLIDFGVSRGRLDNTMTAGVGTPYWTAPEILADKRYTEQADIYSFGVVLSELDTCEIPFHDVKTAEGKKEKPFRILQLVMSGTLRPSFSEDCPSQIRQVGVACCQHDPSRRPNAALLVSMLQDDQLAL